MAQFGASSTAATGRTHPIPLFARLQIATPMLQRRFDDVRRQCEHIIDEMEEEEKQMAWDDTLDHARGRRM